MAQNNLRLTNNKLSKNIIDKIMQNKLTLQKTNDDGEIINYEAENLTKHELMLLLYISQFQNCFGNIRGLYYKDACNYLQCCKQTFYNALYGLENKQYITINFIYKEYKYWDLTILDNIFLSEIDDKKGYFNTNKKFIDLDEFKTLKVNEQKLLIYISYTFIENKDKQLYPKTICSILGIKSVSLVWKYLDHIKTVFPFILVKGKKGDKIIFSKDTNIITELRNTSERENFLSHKIKYILKQRKIKFSSKDIKDLIILLAQKAHYGIGKVISTIEYVLTTKYSVQAALINSLLTKNKHTNKLPEIYWD